MPWTIRPWFVRGVFFFLKTMGCLSTFHEVFVLLTLHDFVVFPAVRGCVVFLGLASRASPHCTPQSVDSRGNPIGNSPSAAVLKNSKHFGFFRPLQRGCDQKESCRGTVP